jgi:hypothetical protein
MHNEYNPPDMAGLLANPTQPRLNAVIEHRYRYTGAVTDNGRLRYDYQGWFM